MQCSSHLGTGNGEKPFDQQEICELLRVGVGLEGAGGRENARAWPGDWSKSGKLDHKVEKQEHGV